MKKKRILFVFAHPDDETFTSGVTICHYANQPDVSIHLLCATRGEAGKPGNPPICTQEELPFVREKELMQAAAILGIDSVEFMGYVDKQLSHVPAEELAAKIQDAIKQHQPQIVITFVPHGISGHPDHQAISAATRLAVERFGPVTPVQKLYYVTHATEKTFGDIAPPYTDPLSSITRLISAPQYVKQVAQALAAHRTQHLSVQRVFPGVLQGDTTYVRDTNYFIRVHLDDQPATADQEKESDLFAGVLA